MVKYPGLKVVAGGAEEAMGTRVNVAIEKDKFSSKQKM